MSNSSGSHDIKVSEAFSKLLEDQGFRIRLNVLSENLAPLISQAISNFKFLTPKLVAVLDGLRDLPDRYREAILVVANEGWYIDPDEMSFDAPAQLAQKILDGRKDEAEIFLIEHFRERISTIVAELSTQFPSRKTIFEQAMEAHRLGLYAVCVPTYLIQVDGVCVEISKKHFFMKARGNKNGHPQIASYIKEITEDPLTLAMLAPLTEIHSINQTNREAGFNKLNRHTVLHGESLDYATEAISLRALSMLYYVSRSLKEYCQKDASKK